MKLRKFNLSDAERVADLVGDYEVSRWTSNIPYPYTVQDAIQWIAMEDSALDRTPWAVELDGKVVACVSYWSIGAGQTEIGYWVGRKYWGKGICTQALKMMLAHDAFPKGDFVIAKVMTENVGSQRVLTKNDFVCIGEKNIQCRGSEVSSLLYERR